MPINLKLCRNVVLALMVAGSACLAGDNKKEDVVDKIRPGAGPAFR
jgi:hypothetical protein